MFLGLELEACDAGCELITVRPSPPFGQRPTRPPHLTYNRFYTRKVSHLMCALSMRVPCAYAQLAHQKVNEGLASPKIKIIS
jgi:hypothetical protein